MDGIPERYKEHEDDRARGRGIRADQMIPTVRERVEEHDRILPAVSQSWIGRV